MLTTRSCVNCSYYDLRSAKYCARCGSKKAFPSTLPYNPNAYVRSDGSPYYLFIPNNVGEN